MLLTPPWYVLTAGPCAGKTTLLNALAEAGYRTVPEAARLHIEEELARGKTLQEIRNDELGFQTAVLDQKVFMRQGLPKDEVIFFDRGMQDTLAYLEHAGLRPDAALLEAANSVQYRKVFLLDLLPYEQDGKRIESSEEAHRIQDLLGKSYQEAGIPLERVPVLPLAERVAYVLARLDV